jgi:hypothetical protein
MHAPAADQATAGWRLTQDAHGFTWTTPAGLTYRGQPHRYPS